MKRIQVFCGSSKGIDSVFRPQVERFAEVLVKEKIGVVYGGAEVGLMGILADKVLELGGEVIGVIPEFLQAKEIAHKNLTQLILVKDLQERKTKMEEISDGTIALPGGYGTLDELFEVLTWAQLGFHAKPTALLNIDGYYDNLILFLDNMVKMEFLKIENRALIICENTPEAVIESMNSYVAPKVSKWIHSPNIPY